MLQLLTGDLTWSGDSGVAQPQRMHLFPRPVRDPGVKPEYLIAVQYSYLCLCSV